ncbi:MAG: NPCBM/NEW2 domain-containing protein [Bryobacterales bacterium]|nr:NPCBM/NEW2 domain-containing protein [Bryobacterales bacterium]
MLHSRLTRIGAIALFGMVSLTGNLLGQTEAGKARFARRITSDWDRYTNAPNASQQDWLRRNIWRMSGVFSPYFDSRLSWFPNAWIYIDLYAIKTDSPLVWQHPEWILKDSAGNRLFIPWNCSNGSCPQYAGDITNAGFRQYWIDQTRALMNKGYKGIWLDDVNMQFRVGNGWGTEIPPLDPRTGTTMTWDNWRKYIAEFVEQIRREFPSAEIMHNCIWFAGPNGIRDNDQYIQRQISAANYINVERGFGDPGLTGGTGEWSLQALLAFIDRVHARGRHVVIDDYYPQTLEYGLANYFLINNGSDALGELISTPDNWYAGYDVNLGAPTGARTNWNNLLRRDFQNGLVLVNEPGAPTRTVTLPGTYRTVNGVSVTSVTLAARQGAVLTATQAPTAPPPTSTAFPLKFLSDLNWSAGTNGYGPIERDRSNGESGADGKTITLNGVTYAKGLGVHANSDVRFALGGVCTAFQADIGMDDEVGANGSVIFQVMGDGTVLYTSGVMTGNSNTLSVNVDLTGRNELRLIVNDAGNGIAYDHADWANARIRCNSKPPATAIAQTAYLSDLAWTVSNNGWGPVERDRSNNEMAAQDGNPLRLNGVTYAKGLGVHAPSDVRFTLGGACSTFHAEVGVDDETGPWGSISFQVWADGTQLYNSGTLTGLSGTQTVQVGIAGRQELRLVVTDAANGISWDHGNWANARVSCNP